MTRRSEAVAVLNSQRRFGVGSVLLGSLLALGLTAQPVRAQEQAQQPPPGLPLGPVVTAPAGPVQGLDNNGVYEYLGIPYAQPPVGALRWQPPQPYPSWTQTLKATHFGPTCAQITTLGVFAGQQTTMKTAYTSTSSPRSPVRPGGCPSWSGFTAAGMSMERATTTMEASSPPRAARSSSP